MRALFAGRVRQLPVWCQNLRPQLRNAPILVVPDTPQNRSKLGIETGAKKPPMSRGRLRSQP